MKKIDSRTIENSQGYATFVCGPWYVTRGASTINATDRPDKLEDGIDLCSLRDYDCFTSNKPVSKRSQLVALIRRRYPSQV